MNGALRVLRVGLTGGIGSGKTTVASFLADCGAFVQNADGIVHELIRPGGTAYDEVVSRFGRDILDASGEISRPKLGEIVFGGKPDDDIDIQATLGTFSKREGDSKGSRGIHC